MKLFFKTLSILFIMIIITVGETKSSPVANILQNKTSYSLPLDEFGLINMTGQQYLTGIAAGGLLGGAANGITALANGRTFWSGNLKPPPMTPATIRPELPSLNSSKPEVNTDGLRSRPLEMTPERPVFSETLEPGPITVKLSGELREVEIAAKGGGNVGKNVFTVAEKGIVLPKGAKIPEVFIQNPYRSSSYGVFENGKFVEKLRIDPATLPGFKGPNQSHFHLNNGGHIFDPTKWLWWY